MTLEVSELFSRELTRYIEETEEIAMSGLKVNRHILDMITNELLENSRITRLLNVHEGWERWKMGEGLERKREDLFPGERG
ncbi:unnamed protein product, partial [Vitis vinifera]